MRSEGRRKSAARVVARLVARDGNLDWREIEFLKSSGAFGMLGVTRREFTDLVAQCLGERLGRRAAGYPLPGIEADVQAVRERRLQLVVAALLVYASEIDRDVHPSERALVEWAFENWGITPHVLEAELSVPAARSQAVLYPSRLAA